MNAQEITEHFYRKIPISRELGIQVLAVSENQADVAVPLTPNINHVQSAFGGSLYAVSALSCYALFQAIAQKAGGLSDTIVIQEGKIRYLAPVLGDFRVKANPESPQSVARFIETLRRQGKARLNLTAQCLWQNQVCAEFAGIYVYSDQKLQKDKS